ncbi:MBL fold metallo-hydrolase [Flocculibacter collagenilyticus]|uniref:MBL fold metallo-hydrolase n=1 Tax=Flocculibacter collagenilyticus TaxID=2744479 RepID=UPI0018F4EF34|nr:MBL fold metallo-hydrolase [Flocculibacter collagenilyticus]
MKVIIIPVTPFAQNCTILICQQTNKAAVIDPGGDIDKIAAQLRNEGATLDKILLTHAHLDHVGGTIELAKLFNVDVVGPHKDDEFWLDMLPQQAQMFNFPPASVFKPNKWLAHNDTVSFGAVTLDVLHCPGHTPGHVVFYHSSSKLLIVGDVLFKGSIGRTDFPKGDHATLIASIKNNLFSLPDDVTFLPGHGPQSTLGHEKQTNPYLQQSTHFG